MSSTIFSNSGTEVKTLKDQLSLNDTAKIRTGTDDPRSVAKEGAQGSIYLQTGSSGGKVFKKLDSGTSTNWSEVGSGAGGINYITNPDAEAGTTGWVAYADAAGAIPVDGTGGSPTVTITTSASSPLRGLNSFLLTKDAANRQGNGVSAVFTIDAADKAEVMAIEIDYAVSSGTFVAGTASDVQVFVYDVTNAVLIQPVATTLQSNTQSKYKGLFQSSSNSTSYRLILHCATTSAAAYVLKFDNVRVGPQAVLFGSPVTDFKSYTLTIGATTTPPTPGTVTVNNAQWRRVGDCMEIRYDFLQTVAGTAGTGGYLFPIPSGYTIDLAKVDGEGGYNACVGAAIARAGTTAGTGTVNVFNSTNLAINVFASSGSTFATVPGPVGSTYYALTFADIEWSFTALVPIVGWSSQVQMSDASDTRVVTARARGATASVTSGNIIIHGTEDFDTHGAYDTSTGRFTCPVTGYYRVESFLVDANASHTLTVYKNAATDLNLLFVDTASGRGSGSLTLSCVAGDILDIRPNATTGAIDPQSWVTFTRVSGPSAIAANELVAARYTTAAGQSITTNTDTIVNFGTSVIDTHAAVTVGASWKFTAPASGTYRVSSLVAFTAGNGGSRYFQIFKNGAAYTFLDSVLSFGSGQNDYIRGQALIKLVPGDYIDIQVFQNTGISKTLIADALSNYVDIERLGF